MAIKDKVKLPERQPESLTVTVSRTAQIRQFEPVHVSVTQVYTVGDSISISSLRRTALEAIGSAVEQAIDKEIDRYSTHVRDD